ncbi:MAG: ParA family protein, partial [Pseudomonadota bacterium]
MTTFVTVTNRRGGVGKTTTTSMLAYAYAVIGFQKTLVIDFDAQSSTSITLLGHERWKQARMQNHTVAGLLRGLYAATPPALAEFIAPQAGDVHITPGNRAPDLSVIPGSFALDDTEREMLLANYGGQIGSGGGDLAEIFTDMQQRVRSLIRRLEGLYDVVIMDCPPGLSNVAWGAVQAGDFVVVPYVPDATAEDNVGWLVNRLTASDPNRQIRLLANRVRMNNPYQRGIIDTVMARYPSLGLVMPQRAAIEGALEFRAAPQSLNQKFGDGRAIGEELFASMLDWTGSAG